MKNLFELLLNIAFIAALGVIAVSFGVLVAFACMWSGVVGVV